MLSVAAVLPEALRPGSASDRITQNVRKLLVCGGRTYQDRERLSRVLDEMHAADPVGCVISGGANGADMLGEAWAAFNRIPVMRFPAHWISMGAGAGLVRNLWMIEIGQPDAVVAFPGGTGTRDMVRKANKAGIPVWKIE